MDRILPKKASLIPSEAKRVFIGEIFDVYQWIQKLYDGSEAVFEMLRRPDTVIILSIVDDKIIYVKDQQPPNLVRVNLPGGRVDPGESWDVAAKREMLEETGMHFDNWRLISVHQPVLKIEWFVACYLAWGTDESLNVQPDQGPGEKIEVLRGSLEEVLNKTVDFIPSAIKSTKSIDELLNMPEYKG